MFEWIFARYFYDVHKYRELADEIVQAGSGRKIAVYCASKPLQYINLRNIPQQQCCYRILCIGTLFMNAEDFIERIREKEKDVWDRIVVCHSLKDMYSFFWTMKHIDYFYTNDDFGFSLYPFLRKLWKNDCEISLYEEGCSMYCNGSSNAIDYSHPRMAKNKLLRFIYNKTWKHVLHIVGSGTWYGDSIWTKHVYAYYPEYPKISGGPRKALGFLYPLSEMMQRMSFLFPLQESPWDELMKVSGKKILLVATSWGGIYQVSEEDKIQYDLILIKYHPHILKKKDEKMPSPLYPVYGCVPMELIVLLLDRQKNEVTVRSKISSSMIYFRQSRIKTEFFDQTMPVVFEEIWDYLGKRK